MFLHLSVILFTGGSLSRGVSVRETPIAVATHPTGMHSCFFVFFTCKQSLGQGNFFSPVCRSVHRGPASGGLEEICI